MREEIECLEDEISSKKIELQNIESAPKEAIIVPAFINDKKLDKFDAIQDEIFAYVIHVLDGQRASKKEVLEIIMKSCLGNKNYLIVEKHL